jgi:hypothetical protein
MDRPQAFPSGNAAIATLIGVEDHMRIVSGRLPTPNAKQIEAIISLNNANALGINIGEHDVASTANGKQSLPLYRRTMASTLPPAQIGYTDRKHTRFIDASRSSEHANARKRRIP